MKDGSTTWEYIHCYTYIKSSVINFPSLIKLKKNKTRKKRVSLVLYALCQLELLKVTASRSFFFREICYFSKNTINL